MNFIEEWKKLKEWDYYFFSAIFMGLVSPGILFIWRFFPQYIETITTAKLVLLAISCTMPVNTFNMILITRFPKEHQNTALPVAIAVACYVTVFILGILLLLSIILPLKIREFVGLVVVLELVFFLHYKNSSIKEK